MAKKRKHKKAKKSHSRKRRAKRASNPRKKRRARRSRARKSRSRRSVSVTVRTRNPSLKDLASAYGPVAAAGLAQPLWELGLRKVVSMADKASGGMISKVVGPIDAQVPGLSTPVVSFLALEGLKWADKKFLKGALQTDKPMVRKAIDVMQTVNAAQVGMLVSQKWIVPPVAKAVGLNGADFGVIPQGLSGADFGRTQADFGNVKYFPGQSDGMGEVQYVPDGSSIENHGIGDLLEDQEQMGVIPQGMGEMPEGLGDGQMG